MRYLVCLLTLAVAASADPGGTWAQWTTTRDQLLRDPTLLRFYSFHQVNGEQPVENLAKPGDQPLRYQAAEPLKIVPGRFPESHAVRLDKGTYYSDPFPIEKAFTAELWVRKNGMGTMRGNPGSTNGTLLSNEGGYWDGFRLTTSYPDLNTGFEMGRPAPSSAVGLGGGALPDGVWVHVAITWDGREMRVYHNGLLAGRAPFTDAYTPSPKGAHFRVGYAGFGWGSAVLDVDEIRLYGRARTAWELFRSAHFYCPVPEPAAAAYQRANAAYDNHDWAAAGAAYGEIVAMPGLHPDLQAVARLRLGQVLIARGDSVAAAPALAGILDLAGISDRYRQSALLPLLQLARSMGDAIPTKVAEYLLALPDLSPADALTTRLGLAHRLRGEGKTAEAQRQCTQLLAMTTLTAEQRRDLLLEQAHAARESGDLATAQRGYAALAADTAAAPDLRTQATLLVADCQIRAKRYDAALTTLGAVAQDPAVHPHLRWQAGERSQEVKRLAKGLPARDPAASRTTLPPLPPTAVEEWVAPDGKPDGNGSKERPFGSVAAALKHLRELRALAKMAPGSIVVRLRGGEYPLKETLALTAADSGTVEMPLVIAAAPGEQPRLTGGAPLKGFSVVTDPAVLARLPEESRGKVLQCDLKANGLTDYGTLQRRGYGNEPTPLLEVFWGETALTPARWPNEGFAKYGAVPDKGGAQRGMTLAFDHPRLARWMQAKDAWLYGYFEWLWADESVGVASFDAATQRIVTRHAGRNGVEPNMPIYVFNLLEEIDQPGEMYLDRANGILYVWPPSDPAKTDVQVSMLPTPLATLTGLSHARLSGLTFELGRFNGLELTDCEDVVLAGCTVRQIGGIGIVIGGGHRCGILGCDVLHLGRGGTAIAGGDRKTLTPGGHYIENTRVYDFSRVDRTYTPAVLMNGVGNRIAHNLFSESPCHAIRLEGNDHIVEFNEVHSVVWESDDQGGVDMWNNVTYRGNQFRYNFWHHIGSGHDIAGQAGIRFDDAISGQVVYGNVFWKCAGGGFGGVQIHGGKENVIDNNLFIDCKAAVSFSSWGEARWKQYLASPGTQSHLKEVNTSTPPYSTHYPDLSRLTEGIDANLIWRNLAVNCGSLLMRSNGKHEVLDNLVTGNDPGFVSPAARNYGLKPNSPPRSGFQPIPFDEIGLYRDPNRASWPVDNPITSHYKG